MRNSNKQEAEREEGSEKEDRGWKHRQRCRTNAKTLQEICVQFLAFVATVASEGAT